jgi:hypothetical protein
MPRLTAPKKPGQPNALSGRSITANLDAGSLDRIAWIRHVLLTLLGRKGEAGTSVVLRRAVALYTAHITSLLTDLTVKQRAEQLKIELRALQYAAEGEREAIDEDKLTALPLRPFGDIYSEDREERKSAVHRQSAVDSLPLPAAPWGREDDTEETA